MVYASPKGHDYITTSKGHIKNTMYHATPDIDQNTIPDIQNYELPLRTKETDNKSGNENIFNIIFVRTAETDNKSGKKQNYSIRFLSERRRQTRQRPRRG